MEFQQDRKKKSEGFGPEDISAGEVSTMDKSFNEMSVLWIDVVCEKIMSRYFPEHRILCGTMTASLNECSETHFTGAGRISSDALCGQKTDGTRRIKPPD